MCVCTCMCVFIKGPFCLDVKDWANSLLTSMHQFAKVQPYILLKHWHNFILVRSSCYPVSKCLPAIWVVLTLCQNQATKELVPGIAVGFQNAIPALQPASALISWCLSSRNCKYFLDNLPKGIIFKRIFIVVKERSHSNSSHFG